MKRFILIKYVNSLDQLRLWISRVDDFNKTKCKIVKMFSNEGGSLEVGNTHGLHTYEWELSSDNLQELEEEAILEVL